MCQRSTGVTIIENVADFSNALNHDFDALAAQHNGREVSLRQWSEMHAAYDALLEIAAFECMRSLAIEVGVMHFAGTQTFYVNQTRYEEEPQFSIEDAIANRGGKNPSQLFHTFSTSGDAMRFASAVQMAFYSQQAEECGGEISA